MLKIYGVENKIREHADSAGDLWCTGLGVQDHVESSCNGIGF
jgi:hypothetical protein